MTTNKQTVTKYMEGFRKGDHTQILSCLTDDVVWEIPGAFHLVGKEAFDGEAALARRWRVKLNLK